MSGIFVGVVVFLVMPVCAATTDHYTFTLHTELEDLDEANEYETHAAHTVEYTHEGPCAIDLDWNTTRAAYVRYVRRSVYRGRVVDNTHTRHATHRTRRREQEKERLGNSERNGA